jgi:uncharacterized protein with HEPN domain
MSAKKFRVQDYLEHIREGIERIQRYVGGMDHAAFFQNEMVQDAVIRNIEIIGEASNNIRKSDPDFVEQRSAIPWAAMYAMRNRVSHAYHEVDLDILWKTVQNDLSPIYQQVVELLESVNGSSATPGQL